MVWAAFCAWLHQLQKVESCRKSVRSERIETNHRPARAPAAEIFCHGGHEPWRRRKHIVKRFAKFQTSFDFSHPEAVSGGDTAIWHVRQGWGAGWSGCGGFQLDGPDFSEVITGEVATPRNW